MQDATESEPEPSSSSGAKDNHVSACTVCGTKKSSSSVLDLSANHVMQRRLTRDWKLPTEIISKTLRAICVECVCKLNMHSEVTRKLMLRLQRFTASASASAKVNAVAAPTQRRCSPPIADAEVSTTGSALPQEELSATSARAASRSSSSSCSVLQAYSAQPPESPSATESGGVHNNSGNSDGWKWRTRLVCQYCERVYFRKDLYTMHVRRCWRKRSQRHRKCRVLNEAANDDDDDDKEQHDNDNADNGEEDANTSVETEQTDPPRHSRTFQCKQCDKEFDGVVALRQHQRSTHQSLRRCSLCEAQFGTQYEWDLHHTICSAKQEALKLMEVETARSMRARSMRSRSRSRASVCYNEDKDNTVDDEGEEEGDDSEEQGEDEEQRGEQAMFKRRMNFTGDWIVNHSRSNSNSALNLNMLYDGDELEESTICSGKEYDLYMLDQLMAQVKSESFSCFAANCYYQTDTLVELMKHDYLHHWKMSWFYCHKCGDVFTSKVFLDYHLHKQNRGVYICHKCHEEFEFQHLLDRHQLLHSKGINYHCNYCRLEFLSVSKLLAHCERQRHSPNDEPRLICIDHELSISNPVPKEPKQVRRYSSRILHIPHKPWPSNRPMHLPQHKPFRFAIGICEFDNHNPPNCVGCH